MVLERCLICLEKEKGKEGEREESENEVGGEGGEVGTPNLDLPL